MCVFCPPVMYFYDLSGMFPWAFSFFRSFGCRVGESLCNLFNPFRFNPLLFYWHYYWFIFKKKKIFCSAYSLYIFLFDCHSFLRTSALANPFLTWILPWNLGFQPLPKPSLFSWAIHFFLNPFDSIFLMHSNINRLQGHEAVGSYRRSF